jgi:hypothetical protein
MAGGATIGMAGDATIGIPPPHVGHGEQPQLAGVSVTTA